MNEQVEGCGPSDDAGREDDGVRRRAGANDPVGSAYRAGRKDLESRNRLIQQNLGLVRRVARQFMHRGLTFEDLCGEGNLGLIRAAQGYDPGAGTRFSTYADYWIRAAIHKALANTVQTIRLPIHVSRLLVRWHRAEKALWNLRGQPPTFEDVATAMDLDGRTQRLLAKAHRVARLRREPEQNPDYFSPSLPIRDESVPVEETLTAREERESVASRLAGLERTERTVVSLRYGLAGEPAMSLEQIAVRMGTSVRVVSKTVASAMRKLGSPTATPHAVGRSSYGACVG